MRARHLLPNAITLANIAFGFCGIVAAADGRFERAVLLLFLAAMCDLLDGRVARMLDASSRFGMELDSLSDVVSFGIAPPVVLYLSSLRQLGAAGAAAAIAYALCAAVRLARYNVDSNPLSQLTFLGAPVPVAAGYISSFVLLRGAVSPWWLLGGTVWVAGCMVSTLKVPKFRRGTALPTWMMLAGVGLFVLFLASPRALTWHLWNGWNVLLIVANYAVLGRRRQLGQRQPRSLRSAA